MKNCVYLFLLAIIFFNCQDKEEEKNESITELKNGSYRATLAVMDDEQLPFVFKVVNANTIEIYNADEKINVDEIEYKNDSVFIKMPAFEGYIAAKLLDDKLEGSFVKESLDRTVPFVAYPDITERFEVKDEATVNVSGSWETVFSEGIEEDEYIAKGIFKQNGNIVTGTFRTTTGDYRFLEGVVDGNQLKLSTFDGAHAFLFTADVTDSTMNGNFYSGNHHKEPFTAKRNDTYELPSANELTYIKEGYEGLEFSFPDLEGNEISLSDEEYKNKVVLVQIMGSWCPNCLDESKYYAEYYDNRNNADLEIIALAFEYAKTEEKAINSLKRLKENVGINYPIALAQYGTSSKIEAQKKLPMLNHVLSYPTTIFIDKNGKVRKIHTGFNGPATGRKFDEFKSEFNQFVDQLLSE